MTASADARLTRTQAQLLRALRDRGPQSVAELGDLPDYARPRITADISALRASGLLDADGSVRSRGGRPSSVVRWARDARFLGIDVGESSLSVAITDGELEILHRLEEDTDPGHDAGGVLAQASRMADQLRRAVGGHVLGAGVGVPATVTFGTGICAAAAGTPGWDGFPVRAVLSRALGTTVTVDNDANVMALGELHRGAARGESDLVFVKAGTSVRCGVVLGGRLHRGVNSTAGDIGHVRVGPDSVSCRCGRTGCLDAVFSTPAVVRGAVVAALAGQSRVLSRVLADEGVLTVSAVAMAAGEHDLAALQIIADGARFLGRVLGPVVDVIDPRLVVLGGALAELGEPLLAATRDATLAHTAAVPADQRRIVLSSLGDRAGEIGGAVLASDSLLAAPGIAAGSHLPPEQPGEQVPLIG